MPPRHPTISLAKLIRGGAFLVAVAGTGLSGCRQSVAQQGSSRDNHLRQAQPNRVAAAPARDNAGGGRRYPGEGPNTEWWLPNGDYANTRYSTLNDINTANVVLLKVVTTMSTGIPHGHEGQPLVVGSTMYAVTPFPNLMLAVDLTKPGGKVKWTFDPHADGRAVGVACCDVVNRGASYGDGKIVYNVLDGRTIAVDAKTGKQVWSAKVANPDVGETLTMAPLIVGKRVFIGNSGGEMGVRGWLKALDLASGKVLWTAYNTGPDQDVLIGDDFHPYYKKDQGKDLGVSSWSGDQWKIGGSTVWGWISYDPELNLVYYSTGNPGAWNPDMRPGDNKWSLTIFARNPETGAAKWAYQIAAHDAWDYDEIMENVLVDLPVDGKVRKLLLHPGRTGFLFVMDRETGELLSAEKFQYVNWADHYDIATGKPVENPEKRTREGEVTRDICPSSTGAKEFEPTAFSPRTGLLYIPSMHLCMDYEGMEANYIAGTPYMGAEVRMYPGSHGPRGQFIAWDPVKQKKIWGIGEDFPVHSGVLVTAGDVAFYGTMDGWFKAVDARTGSELWKFKTGSGIVGSPFTYVGPDSKQYVAVYSGIGGWLGAVAFPDISMTDPTAALGVVGGMVGIKEASAPGGTLYVFALGS
jgi:PQQ-dependent dehydrogenase (methanol/ethanol family)